MIKVRDLCDPEFLKRLRALTMPMVLQSLMLALVAVSDALMLGNVAQSSMSAVSLATQIQFIQNVTLGALTSAVSVLTAQYWGKKDEAAVQHIMAIGLRVCGAVSTLFFTLCVLLPESLMLLFTDVDELIVLGAKYLCIAGWSYLLTGLSQPILTVIKATGHPKRTALISSCTVILNIILNAIFIFGWLGLPAMGVEGAAVATLICRIIQLLWALLSCRKKGFVSLDIRKLIHFHKVLSRDYRRCALPLLGAGLFWGVGFAAYSAFMGHTGADAVAANSVAAVVRDLVCCLCDGLAAGGGVLVGNELGAGRLKEGKVYGRRITLFAYIIGFLSAVIMLLATPLVVNIVRLTDAAAGYLNGMMIIMSVYMIGRAVNTVVINGIFAAGGDTMFDLYSLAVVMWGLAVPLAALGTFVFHWPALLIYACTCLDEVGKIPWVMLHYKKFLWVKDLTRELTNA